MLLMCLNVDWEWFQGVKIEKFDLGLFSWKSRNLKEILEKILKVWVWFKLDCVGNEFRLMIQVFKNF